MTILLMRTHPGWVFPQQFLASKIRKFWKKSILAYSPESVWEITPNFSI